MIIFTLVALLSVHESQSFSNFRIQSCSMQHSNVATTATVPSAQDPSDHKPTTESQLVIKTKRSLYEILRAPRNASKAELKVQYVSLARETHPDALIGGNKSLDATASFSEIAEAYKVLSNSRDRRRYDRSLVAEAFAENIEEIAFKVGEQAGPSVMKAFEKVAVPFLRRTAVTAVASFSAAAEDLIGSNGTKMDLGHAAWTAIKAGEAAGRIVDGMELLEKSQELEKRALDETERSIEVHANLSAVINKRMHLALRTPNSSLSSSDALKLLDGLNTKDSLSLMDMVRLKHTIVYQIGKLEEVETEYSFKSGKQQKSAQQFAQLTDSLRRAEHDAKIAVEEEVAARKALELAMTRAAQAKQFMKNMSHLRQLEEMALQKTTTDVDRVSPVLARRQEKVRKALRAKEEAIKSQKAKRRNERKFFAKADNDDDEDFRLSSIQGLGLADLEELAKQEILLMAESKRLDELASRLLSRAAKLRARADSIESERG